MSILDFISKPVSSVIGDNKSSKPIIPPVSLNSSMAGDAPILLRQVKVPPKQTGIEMPPTNQEYIPEVKKPTFDPSKKTYISAAPKEPFYKSMLPKGFRDWVSEGLFGKEVPTAKGTIKTKGLLEGLFPGLALSEFEKFEKRKRALMQEGSSLEEAEAKAFELTNYGRENLSLLEKYKRKKEIGNAFDSLSKEEQKALKKVAVFEGVSKALDSLNFVGFGTIAGKTSAKIIAQTADKTLISKTLQKEIPSLSVQEADAFSDIFRVINKEEDVESAITKIRFKKEQFKGTIDTPLEFLSQPISNVAPSAKSIAPMKSVKDILQKPISEVIQSAKVVGSTIKESNIPTDLEPLAEEVKKYKSVEEFKSALQKGELPPGSIDAIRRHYAVFEDLPNPDKLPGHPVKITNDPQADFYNQATQKTAFRSNLPDDFRTSTAAAEKIIRQQFTPQEVGVFFADDLGKDKSGIFEMTRFQNRIRLLDQGGKVSDSTIYHEMFHASFNLRFSEAERKAAVDKILNNPKTRALVDLKYRNYKTPEERAEEWLADDYAKFKENPQTYKGFFRDLWEKLLDYVRGIIRRSRQFDKIYNEVDTRKTATQNNRELSRFKDASDSESGYQSGKEKTSKEIAKTQNAGDESESMRIVPDKTQEIDPAYEERSVSLDGPEGAPLPKDKTEQVVGKVKIGDKEMDLTKAGRLSARLTVLQEFANTNAIDDIVSAIKQKNLTEQEIHDVTLKASFIEEALDANPAKQLIKYVSKTTGRLPEVTGKPTMKSLTGSGKVVQNSEFGRRGDDIVTEHGFKDPEEAQVALDQYVEERERLNNVKKTLYDLRREKLIAKKGEELMKITMQQRRARFKLLKRRYDLDDADLASIRRKRDLSLMTEEEFKNFIIQSELKAEALEIKKEARMQVEATIAVNELKKTENLQRAMNLPQIKDMTTEQLREFDAILSHYQKGDEFLGVRKLETIDKTALAGAKTYREAREKLAKALGMDVQAINTFRRGRVDRFRWDTSLAERNPFYKLVVENFNASLLEGEARYLSLEEKVNKMMNQLRKGTSRLNRLIPTDDRIFSYLQASPEEKGMIAKDMTKLEYSAAQFFRDEFNKALRYEYEQHILHKSRYEDSYITHIRRDYLEAIKTQLQRKDNILKAFWIATKELFDKYKQDHAVLNILDQKTGQILPMEKFFKFAMERTGDLVPSKNVAKAFLEYMRIFETKKALDKVIPEIMTYVDVLTPRSFTPKGLFTDDKLRTFVTQYINNKKGRPIDFVVEPGGEIDGTIKATKNIITILDLGANFITQIASHGGAQAAVVMDKGFKGWARGWQRQMLPKYRQIAHKYENYTGRPPWKNLMDASKGVAPKIKSVMFYLFQSANVWAKKIHLLSSLTEAEIRAGEISSQRLAQIQNELGRWYPIEKAESLAGSTSVGSSATQYRKWAVSSMRTFVKNFNNLFRKRISGQQKKKEAAEMSRALILGMTTLVIYQMAVDGEQKDDSFIERLIRKTLQDINSTFVGIDPITWRTPPRLLGLAKNILDVMVQLTRMEKYKVDGKDFEKGNLKGPVALRRMFTPAVIRNIKMFKDQINKSGPKINLDKTKLPPLPKLPKLPKMKDRLKLKGKELPPLPKLPKLPKNKLPTLD